MAATGGRRGPIVGINVTPMVDVVLVLLVIMMVTATYIVAQTLKVELPKTASSDEAVTTVAKVTLAKDRATYWNDERVDEAELDRRLRAAEAADSDLNLVVSADRAVPHGDVVHVIDRAKLAGITKFAINVERSE